LGAYVAQVSCSGILVSISSIPRLISLSSIRSIANGEGQIRLEDEERAVMILEKEPVLPETSPIPETTEDEKFTREITDRL
jgi:hypothetical protein